MNAKDIQKYQKKSIPQLLEIAKRHFHAFIRKRDSKDGYFTCISCRKTYPVSQMNAGHYWAAGNYSVHRFDEWNVNGQCGFNCNKMKSGNLSEYKIGLIKKIGEENFKWLEDNRYAKVKWDRFSLINIIETYKNK